MFGICNTVLLKVTFSKKTLISLKLTVLWYNGQPVLVKGWCTRQVDYTNAFAQAELEEEVYVEPPHLFAPKSGKDLVLQLLKSLYRWRQAPHTFFKKLCEGPLDWGYVQSAIDPCLFMKKGIICVCYVDDTIFAGADSKVLKHEIKNLGVTDEEQ